MTFYRILDMATVAPSTSPILEAQVTNDEAGFGAVPLLLVGTLWPAWSALLYYVYPAEVDSIFGRLCIGALAIVSYFLVERVDFFKRHMNSIILGVIMLTTFQFYWLTYKGGLSDVYMMGGTVVAAGTSAGLANIRHCLIQTIFSVSAASLISILLFGSNDKAPLFVSMILTIHVVVFFTLRARVKIGSRLKDARLANLEMKRALLEQELSQIRVESQKLRQLSYEDSVTKLPNRYYFEKQCLQALDRFHQEEVPFVLLFIDLDKFKAVNDTYGHKIGDLTLSEAARRIKNSLRRSDIVARQGGDEFVALLSGLDQVETVLHLCDKIKDSLTMPMKIEGKNIYIGASVGMAFCPRDGATIESLMQHADSGMYKQKQETALARQMILKAA